MEESRVDRLMRLAEEAANRGELEQSEQFANLVGLALFVQRKEARDLAKMHAHTDVDPIILVTIPTGND